jgi:tungstate transport system substrate-binding protein
MRLLFAILLVLFVWSTLASTSSIKMATTTSTENSGLLAVLLPRFETQTGISVHVIAVGTGKALKLAENGDVDLVFVHAREAEDEFVSRGFGVARRDVMYNDFVIVGPEQDPAALSKTASAAAALAAIARARAPFVSRGDESGTHKKEKALWSEAGLRPSGDWYIEAGQGMGAVLIMADEKQAYTLADRGTFISFGDKVDLVVLSEDDSALHNPYGIIAVNPQRHQHVRHKEATEFIQWITSDEGQKLIGEYRINGRQLFHPSAK